MMERLLPARKRMRKRTGHLLCQPIWFSGKTQGSKRRALDPFSNHGLW